MGFATTTTGHVPHTTKSADSKVLLHMNVGSVNAVVIQTKITTTEEWRGLSWDDAQALVIASETSTLGGVTRPYLGAVKLTVTMSQSRVWNMVEQAFGTRIRTNCTRMSDTNLYQVMRTTEEINVSKYGGGEMELL